MMIRVMVIEGNGNQGRTGIATWREQKFKKPPACIAGEEGR